MDIALLTELKSKLKRGEIREIAEVAKSSTTTISNWLMGREYPRQDEKIIEAIKTVINRRNKQLEKHEQELKTLITQL